MYNSYIYNISHYFNILFLLSIKHYIFIIYFKRGLFMLQLLIIIIIICLPLDVLEQI